MARTDVLSVKLDKHLKSIQKLKKQIKLYENKKSLTKLFSLLKIQDGVWLG